MTEKLGFKELQEKVVAINLCTGCAACYLVCPFKDVLDYIDETPVLIGECRDCGICPRVCPQHLVTDHELDVFTFGRERREEEDFGVYEKLLVAKSKDDEILERAQDGGVVTTLLTSALDSALIDGALLSSMDPDRPRSPIPLIAKTREEAIRSAGTRYSYSPGLALLREGLDGLESVAFVGTPCQINAVRTIQKFPLKHTKHISYTIGLFCSESFSYEGLLLEKMQNDMNIDLRDVSKVNIKGGLLIYSKGGHVWDVSLKEAKVFARPLCKSCRDFSAEHADISCGGVGLEGWTLTIIRTEKGLRLFEEAVEKELLEVKAVEDFPSSLKILTKLSKVKRKRSVA